MSEEMDCGDDPKETGNEGPSLIELAFQRLNKGKWHCKHCLQYVEEKYNACRSCTTIKGQTEPPKGGAPSPLNTTPSEPFNPPASKPFNFDPSFGNPSSTPPLPPQKTDSDASKSSFSFTPGSLSQSSEKSSSFTFKPPTLSQNSEKSLLLHIQASSSSFTFNTGNTTSSPAKFTFTPPTSTTPKNKDLGNAEMKSSPLLNLGSRSNSPLNVEMEDTEKPATKAPGTPPAGKPPVHPVKRQALPTKAMLLQNTDLGPADSPATRLSSMSINPFNWEPEKPMPLELVECLKACKESEHTQFILACGDGGMGSTGLGGDPDDDPPYDPEASEAEEDDEDFDDPYEARVPKMIELPDLNWVDMCCGSLSGAVVSGCGQLFVWGVNDHGNMGVPGSTKGTFFKPTKVQFSEPIRVRKVGMGGSHTVVCDHKGQVWSAGTFKNDGQVGHHYNQQTDEVVKDQSPFVKIEQYSNMSVTHMRDKDRTLPPIVDVKSGVNHFLMLDEDGRLWEMGITAFGQRFSKRNQKKYLQPRMCPFVGSLAGVRAQKMCCGSHFNLVLSRDGDVYSWGQNNFMQCGHPRTDNHGNVIDLPQQIAFPMQVTITHIAAGEHFAVALDSDGRVWTWGRNASRTLGRDTEVPPRKPNQFFDNEASADSPGLVNLPPVEDISAGPAHWFALTKGGQVIVFGSNLGYRTGIADYEGEAKAEVVFDDRNTFTGDFEVLQTSGGSQHSLFHVRKTANQGKRRGRFNDRNGKRQRN